MGLDRAQPYAACQIALRALVAEQQAFASELCADAEAICARARSMRDAARRERAALTGIGIEILRVQRAAREPQLTVPTRLLPPTLAPTIRPEVGHRQETAPRRAA